MSRCPRPCSICGRLDIPAPVHPIFKPGEMLPVCAGYRVNPCKGDIHPCRDCVFSAPKPWPKDYKIGEVFYEKQLLGRIPIPDVDDSKDEEGTMGHVGRLVLWDLLKANKPPLGMAPQEWILWTLRGIGIAMLGKRSASFEDQVMKRYLRHYGALSGMGSLLKLAKD